MADAGVGANAGVVRRREAVLLRWVAVIGCVCLGITRVGKIMPGVVWLMRSAVLVFEATTESCWVGRTGEGSFRFSCDVKVQAEFY